MEDFGTEKGPGLKRDLVTLKRGLLTLNGDLVTLMGVMDEVIEISE